MFAQVALDRIELVRSHGVRGDAHFGVTVQHRSRVARDPTQPNLRQVHLLHQELLDALAAAGLPVQPGGRALPLELQQVAVQAASQTFSKIFDSSLLNYLP